MKVYAEVITKKQVPPYLSQILIFLNSHNNIKIYYNKYYKLYTNIKIFYDKFNNIYITHQHKNIVKFCVTQYQKNMKIEKKRGISI